MGNGTPQSAPPTTVPTPSPGTPTSGAAPAAPAAPWYGDLSTDPDLKGYAELKAYKDPVAALKAVREAEKLIGAPRDELLRLPKADAKPEDWNPVYDRLGRPKTPGEYQLPAVEGGQEFAQQMAPLLHSAGLNQRQVSMIAEGWNKYMSGAVETQNRAQQTREQADLVALHSEWPGDVYTQREDMARRAVRQFVQPVVGDEAQTVELLGKIEDAIGTAAFLKMWSNVGEKLGEGKFVDGTSRPAGFGMTPDAAKARLGELMADKEWRTRLYNNPKGPEGREQDMLQRIAILGRAA